MAVHQSIKTFHARRGRMSSSRQHILANTVPQYLLVQPNDQIDLRDESPSGLVTIDFGCGMGDATIKLLEQNPDRVVLAMDVHTPGICRIADHAHQNNLTNLRLHHGDGLTVLESWLAPHTIDTLLVLFPDPWPKSRHHKRRLLQTSFLNTAHQLLEPKGRLVIATDDESYAEHITEIVNACSLFERLPINHEIPSTGFARRGLRLGNRIEIFTLAPR